VIELDVGCTLVSRRWKAWAAAVMIVILCGPVTSTALRAAETSCKPQSLANRDAALKREFEKAVIQVTEGVHVAVGFGASSSTLIVGDDGVIIIDTMLGTEAAENVRRAFETVTAKPVRAIIYTHSHSDHTGGAEVFARGHQPEILTKPPAANRLEGYDTLSEILTQRAGRQFGSSLEPEDKIPGIAPVHRPMGGRGEGKLPPTRRVDGNRETLEIEGIELELIPAPGETEDHLLVWLSASRVLICGDNFYASFPNLYAIRGTAYRDVSQWIQSLDLMIDLGAEHLISGHARPITGADHVRQVLTDYRDAIAFVQDETLKGANQGLTPDELAASIRLPANLRDNPYLQEYYGVVAWSVRSIYSGYFGWFDGNPTRLFPLPPRDEATRMVQLVGSRQELLEAVRRALSRGDPQWACQLVDHLLVLDPTSESARGLKGEALRRLAELQMSSNARHYYLSTAKELELNP